MNSKKLGLTKAVKFSAAVGAALNETMLVSVVWETSQVDTTQSNSYKSLLPVYSAVAQPPATGILCNWKPPPLPHQQLLQWTIATTEMATIRHLSATKQPTAIRNLVQEVNAGAAYAMDHSPQVGCRACQIYCAECCHAEIVVSAPEILDLADYLRANQSTSQIEELIRRSKQIAQETKNLDHNQYAAVKIPCLLLDKDNACSVYPARPARCRT